MPCPDETRHERRQVASPAAPPSPPSPPAPARAGPRRPAPARAGPRRVIKEFVSPAWLSPDTNSLINGVGVG
ncbi:hypothetical protein GCM10027186_09490 [Micromonospora schwarzwaldensis]